MKDLTIFCTCSCSAVKISKFQDEKEYYMNFYASYFVDSSFFARLKQAWKTLKGQNNSKMDLVLSAEDMENISHFYTLTQIEKELK